VKRTILAAVAALLTATTVAACGSSSDDKASTAAAAGTGTAAATAPAEQTITVGVPRNFGYLSTLWARNIQPDGVKVEYKYFPVFTDMLTALNSGKIDLTEIGDVGAVQSYVNGGKVQAVAVTQPNDRNGGLLVPKDSTATSIADLKGKKILFLKSTNSYTGFLHAIKDAGLKESDFQIVEIAGPAANKAFESGQVDAYYTIDPNLADIVEQTGAKQIATYADQGVENLYPYVATTDAIKNKPEAIGAVLQAVADDFTWIKANPDEQAKLVAPKLGFSESAIKTTYARGAEGFQKIDQTFWDHEQPVIDELVAAGIVSKPVKAQDVFIPTFNQYINPQ
jgi:sulfonate transport system substrate-binding protein